MAGPEKFWQWGVERETGNSGCTTSDTTSARSNPTSTAGPQKRSLGQRDPQNRDFTGTLCGTG